MATNAVNWFEIPAADMERAVKFYNTVLGANMQSMDTGTGKYAFFPANGGVGGAIGQGGPYEPGDGKGVIIYLSVDGDLNTSLERVEGAGGKVVVEKRPLGPNGFFARFLDSEGNMMGLFSPR